MPLRGIIFGENPIIFLAIKNFCCQWARSEHTNKCPFHWHWSFEWLVCSVRSSFFARNHAIVSCYATARPGISARSKRWLPPFMWKASWQWRLIRLNRNSSTVSQRYMSWIKGLGITSMKRVNSFIVVRYPSMTSHGLLESLCVKTCQPPVCLATRGGFTCRRHLGHTHEHQISWETSTVSLSGKVWHV